MFYDIIRIQVIVWSTILISAVFSLRINRESCEQCPYHCQCREAPPAWGWRGRAPARRKRNKFEATTWAEKSFWNPIFVSAKSENFVHQSCNVSNKFVFHLYLISSFADLLHCQRRHRIKCPIMQPSIDSRKTHLNEGKIRRFTTSCLDDWPMQAMAIK